jgi:hypothetical protein
MGRTFILAIAMTTVAAAQTQTPPRLNTGDLRYHIYVMEGALMRAVQVGALQVNREMRSISPELFTLAGDTSARGVYLEDYGVYFDVGVPILRPSMLWSWQVIQQRDERNTRELIEELKRMAATERVPGNRRALENSIVRLEAGLQPPGSVGPPGVVSPPVTAGAGSQVGAMVNLDAAPATAPTPGAPTTPTPPPAAAQQTPRIVADRMILKDPNRAYTDAVQRALIDAMIDFSAPMMIGPHEWLTVAARDNAPRDLFAPQDPFDEVVTLLFRIKGEDLAAYRTGKIDREEAKKRVQVKEF